MQGGVPSLGKLVQPAMQAPQSTGRQGPWLNMSVGGQATASAPMGLPIQGAPAKVIPRLAQTPPAAGTASLAVRSISPSPTSEQKAANVLRYMPIQQGLPAKTPSQAIAPELLIQGAEDARLAQSLDRQLDMTPTTPSMSSRNVDLGSKSDTSTPTSGKVCRLEGVTTVGGYRPTLEEEEQLLGSSFASEKQTADFIDRLSQGVQSPSKMVSNSRANPTWRLPWSPPRGPTAPRLVVPYALAKENISEKYAVNWSERIHTGMMNGLNLQKQVSISAVFKAKAKNNSRLLAVKVIHRKHIFFPKLFQQQLSDMHGMDHPSICRLLDVYEDPQHVYMVFENLIGPSLLEKAADDAQFCERDAAAAFKVLLQAIAYLHERNIVHQNLHPENLRYAVSPKKKGFGSAYNDQLKLLDCGFCLQMKHLSQDVQATGTPDSYPLPLLPLIGGRASQGTWCGPPEYQGFQDDNPGSYAQLAIAVCSAESSLARGRSEPNSPDNAWKARRDQTQSRSPQTEDPFTRQVRELHKLLEAGDMWSAGCILHMLLTGSMPAERGSRLMTDNLPTDACELLVGLLRRDPRMRISAAEALQSPWFQRCEAVQRAHRSQTKATSSPTAPATPITPSSDQLRSQLAVDHAACRLRKLVLSLTSLQGAARHANASGADPPQDLGSLVPTPEPPARVTTEALVDMMCHEAYQAMARGKSASPPTLSLGDLVKAVERAGDLPWSNPEGALQKVLVPGQGIISLDIFVEFVREACK